MLSRMIRALLFFSLFAIGSLGFVRQANADEENVKDWTMIVFLNGNNSLSSYTESDLNEMERGVDPSGKVNVVAQWAMMNNSKIKRLHITHDETEDIKSEVVEEFDQIDMGDYNNLIKFIEWSMKKYPAKHYFVDVWNHGSGWHGLHSGRRNIFHPTDISFDDRTNHAITTAQLGKVFDQVKKDTGHKIDVYGSDACLMGMVEVAAEMQDSVNVFIGSEDLEPGDGWPYDKLLKRWNALPEASAQDVGKILVEEYVGSYSSEVTLSAFDMNAYPAFRDKMKNFSSAIAALTERDVNSVKQSAQNAQNFYSDDYRDFIHYTKLLSQASISGIDASIISDVQKAAQNMIIEGKSSDEYAGANGMSFWLPTSGGGYQEYKAGYEALRFNQDTGWSSALGVITK